MERFAVERGVPLARHCSLGIGGPARYLARCRTLDDLREATDFARAKGLLARPSTSSSGRRGGVFVLGRGSNVLFDDRGYDGLVILNEIEDCEDFPPPDRAPSRDHLELRVGSGYPFNTLGQRLSTAGWGGLEFAAGIPGTVGGAVFMNAGSNGRETCEALVSADYLTSDGEVRTLDFRDACGSFSYRKSPFQSMTDLLAIVSGTFELVQSPEAKEKARAYMKRRSATQPLRDKSAGCIFRNPSPASGQGKGSPLPQSAGALIDRAGLKGYSLGTATVSSLHANYIVCSRASEESSSDMKRLIGLVKERVRAEFGVALEEEIEIVPFMSD